MSWQKPHEVRGVPTLWTTERTGHRGPMKPNESLLSLVCLRRACIPNCKVRFRRLLRLSFLSRQGPRTRATVGKALRGANVAARIECFWTRDGPRGPHRGQIGGCALRMSPAIPEVTVLALWLPGYRCGMVARRAAGNWTRGARDKGLIRRVHTPRVMAEA